MATPIRVDYDTPFLLPPSLEDWMAKDDPVRFVREFVEALDLPALGFQRQDCLDGRPPFSNALLLKIWLWGYYCKIRSVRALEGACRQQIQMMWLCGLHAPDHNTLWRFWSANQQALRAVFKQSVMLALDMKLVSLALQAIDGTKIEAASSGHSGWSKERMEQLLEALEQCLKETEKQIQQQEAQAKPEVKLPESLTEKNKLKAAVEQGLKQLQEDGRRYYHRHEPQARRMKCSGRNRFGYNAQAVVDGKKGIVTAAEVSTQETDTGLLKPMLDAAKENTGQTAQGHVADSGYGAAADLAQAKAAGYEVTAPVVEGSSRKQEAFHTTKFIYNRQEHSVSCPQNRVLRFERDRLRHGKRLVHVFRCRHQDCPVRGQCSDDPKGRMVEISVHYEVVQEQKRKLSQPEYQARLRRRSGIVEPVFAWIKQLLGFRRWTVRGLEKVKTQWALLCLTVNLMKLYAARST